MIVFTIVLRITPTLKTHLEVCWFLLRLEYCNKKTTVQLTRNFAHPSSTGFSEIVDHECQHVGQQMSHLLVNDASWLGDTKTSIS